MKKIGFIIFIFTWLIGTGVQASVSDVIKNNEKKEMQSVDATVFVFTYRLMREIEKAFQPIIASPQQVMRSLCGFPVMNSRQLVYGYAAFYDDIILQDIMAFNKSLSVHHKSIVGPLTAQILQHLQNHRKLMEKARILDLSVDVVEALLMDESFKMDVLLAKVGTEISSSVFDTFYEVDMKKLNQVSTDIKNGLKKKCVTHPSIEKLF
ncbi:conserved exported protein of unknown function [Bartonella clarridgeiae 73]|uniref:Uncharacterized protein n=1 Tax=Bartonella clarridgeiae (strain CCUG 45776 / CIP 104772 / 73) TaxID=696125 RepID=E6YJA9_BARC7|nr:hypothetical protein [Bartonella clarridgeiae]WCR55818.1 MAG: hypothetical protein PG977_001211 [Bartonella clarridgeiae]CBI76947.1 conserved exported protein of unknown function [Bartonella clarridgeiae 73]